MAALLEIRDLHMRFSLFEGLSHVLNGISLSIEKGERVAIVGESGCGKSVTVRAILGLLQQRNVAIEGSIRFHETELLGMPERSWREIRGSRISMIFQDPMASLNPTFKVRDQLLKVIRRGGRAGSAREAYDIACAGLRQVAIVDPDRILAAYPFQLSGGLAQRVMITMALVNRPELVLADEPGSALDVTVQEQTLRLMHELTQDAGAAVLLITHNLGVVREFAQRVYVMYAGTIVEEADVETLFRDPAHPYTRALLEAVPKLTGAGLPRPIEGIVPDYTAAPSGCRFHPAASSPRPRVVRRPRSSSSAQGIASPASCRRRATDGRSRNRSHRLSGARAASHLPLARGRRARAPCRGDREPRGAASRGPARRTRQPHRGSPPAPVRPGALPAHRLRPARRRAQHAQGRNPKQHDVASGGRHRGPAPAPRHREVAGDGRLLGLHALAALRPDPPRKRDGRRRLERVACRRDDPALVLRARRQHGPTRGWDEFVGHFTTEERDDLEAALYRRIDGADRVAAAAAARALGEWETSMVYFHSREGGLAEISGVDHAENYGRILSHYFKNRCFLDGDDHVLSRCNTIADIPGIIVQGRYDMCTPVREAWRLKQAWPRAELKIVEHGGHMTDEPGMAAAMVEALDAMAGGT